MVKWVTWLCAIMVAALWVVACGEAPRGIFSQSTSGGDGGSGGIASQSSSGMGGASSSASSSSSSGAPMCGPGGTPCQSFSECCSGTCANNACTECGQPGAPCGKSCCLGLTCYNGICGACGDDGTACVTSGDCCSGVCANGLCADLVCPATQNECGNTCVDYYDNNNCIMCGVVCGAGDSCCQQGCRDTTSDELNCGSCGALCPESTHECINSVCTQIPACCKWVTNGGNGLVVPPVTMPASGSYAWAIVPSCTIMVTRVDLLTGGPTTGVAIAESMFNLPGTIKMQITATPLPAPDDQWVGAVPDAKFLLHAGTTYWVIQSGSVGKPLSMSAGGASVDVVVRPTGGQQWAPFDPADEHPMVARIIGDCLP